MEEESSSKDKFARFDMKFLKQIGMFKRPRKYKNQISDEELLRDLERYKGYALKLGCDDAKIVPASMVKVDERVRLKCRISVCHHYNNCINCPPYTPTVEEMSRTISQYRYALVIKREVEPKDDFIDPKKEEDIARHYRKNMEIVGLLEAQAFSDGYYFAMGFAGGSCQHALCMMQPCSVLEGKRCRFVLKARPAMEAVGIDVIDLATKLGWEVYPVRARPIPPEEFPCAVTFGIVFVH
jgi:predicted metal-binding protein